MSINGTERDAILTLCLFAALADGDKAQSERDRLKTIAEQLGSREGLENLPRLYQDVLFRKTTPQAQAKMLSSPESRTLAYEMAVYVCESDDKLSPAEQAFLGELQTTLAVQSSEAARVQAQGDELIDLTTGAGMAATAAGAGALAGAAPLPQGADAEIDRSIMNHAILAGALELLPQSVATVAVLPVQMKLVYGVGKRYGYTLDRGHIKDFLAAAGVGMSSQVIEGFARRLLGDLAGRLGGVAGRTAAGVARTAVNWGTGPAMSFATTYALGQVAKQYYAGGRKFSAIDLKSLFTSQTEKARTLYAQVAPQIQERARGLNPAKIGSLLSGNS